MIRGWEAKGVLGFGNQGGVLGEKTGMFWVSREGCFGNQGDI